MAYQTRCPECEAKLRLEETPAVDEMLECPKCGNQFTMSSKTASAGKSAPAGKSERSSGKKESSEKADRPTKTEKKPKKVKSGIGKKKKVRKKKSNNFILAMMGLGGFVILLSVIGIGYYVFGRVGKIDSMMSHIPADFNVIRGVNAGVITRYPGYSTEMDTQFGVAMREVADQLAPIVGYDDGKALTDICMHATRKAGGGVNGEMLVIRTRRSYDVKSLATLGGEQNIDGQLCYKSIGNGLMKNALVFGPSNRLIVVVTTTGSQDAIARTSIGGPKQLDSVFVSKLGATGRRISAGHLWTIVASTGDLAKYNVDMAESVKKDFPELGDQLGKAKLFGQWVTFGTGVKVGVAFDCEDKENAKKVAVSLDTGPLGKGDDSEVPNGVRGLTSISGQKEFKSDYLANLTYTYTGECVYAEAKMLFAKTKQIIAAFNNPRLGTVPTRR
jgi:hypothetical protein